MKPYAYLDIPNHQAISQRLLDLFTTSLYRNYSPDTKNTYYTFTPKPGQTPYDIKLNTEFWNMLNTQDLLIHIPELKEALVKLNIEMVNISYIVVKSGEAVLHSDLAGDPELTERVNWPIANAATSETRFYSVKNTVSTTVGKANSGEPNKDYIMYNPRDTVEHLGTYVLSKPIIFNFRTPHSVHRVPGAAPERPDLPRLLLTITVRKSGLLD